MLTGHLDFLLGNNWSSLFHPFSYWAASSYWFIILYVSWVQVFHCFNVLQVSSSAPSRLFNPLYGNFWGNGVKFIISFTFTNTISLYYLLIVLKIPLFTFKSKGQMELIIEHRVGQGSISFCFPNNQLFWYFRYAGWESCMLEGWFKLHSDFWMDRWSHT